MPLSTSNIVLSKLYPMSISPMVDFLLSFIGAMGLYMYIFGYIKQFNIHRFSYVRMVLSVFEIILASILRYVASERSSLYKFKALRKCTMMELVGSEN